MQLELVTNLHEVCSCIITEVLIICPGSPAECDYPLCCSPGQARAGAGAGRWGEYTCDTPPWTLEATLARRLRGQERYDGLDPFLAQLERDLEATRRVAADEDQNPMGAHS